MIVKIFVNTNPKSLDIGKLQIVPMEALGPSVDIVNMERE
jgi:hypothetical protein